jgi:hypothetical protein
MAGISALFVPIDVQNIPSLEWAVDLKMFKHTDYIHKETLIKFLPS